MASKGKIRRRQGTEKVAVPYAPTKKGKAAEQRANRKREVAGPYRSQSSVPSIRKKATKREHRKEYTSPPPPPTTSPSTQRGQKAFATPKITVGSLNRTARKREREAPVLATFKRIARAVPTSPQTAILQAKYAGIKPPDELRKTNPRAYKKAEAAFIQHIASKEGLKDDASIAVPIGKYIKNEATEDWEGIKESVTRPKPLGLAEPPTSKELQAAMDIATVVPAVRGVSAIAKGVETLGAKEVAKQAAESAATSALKKVDVAAGAKAVARGTANVGRRATGKAIVRAAPKPTKQFAAEVVAGTKGLKAAAIQATPVARGHEKALVESPGKTLHTTLRMVPGLATAPVKFVADTGLSIGRLASSGAHAAGIPGAHGYSTKDILDPMKGQLDAQVQFAKEVEKVVTSDDPDYVKREVENHLGLMLPLMAAPVVAKTFKPIYARALETLRRDKEVARALRGSQRRPTSAEAQKLIPAAERRAHRVEEAKRAATTKAAAAIETEARGHDVLREAQKAKGPVEVIREIPKGRTARHPRGVQKVELRPGHAVGFLARNGISRNVDDAVLQIKHLQDRIDPASAAELPKGRINTLDMTRYLLKHPEVLTDTHLWKAVDAYKGQAKSLQSSEAARVQPIMEAHANEGMGQRNPGIRHFDRVPIETRKVTDATTRSELRAEISKDRAKLRRAAARGDKKRTRELAAQIKAKHQGLYAALTKDERAKVVEELAEAGVTKASEVRSALRDARANKAAANDKALEAEYLEQANHLIDQFKHEQPAYATHADVRSKGAPSVSAVGGQLPKIPGGVKQRGGDLQRMGAIDESLHSLMRESVRVPVARKHIFANLRNFIDERAVRFGDKIEVTSREAGKLMDDGVFDPKHNLLIPRQLYKRAFDALEKGDESGIASLREVIGKDGQKQILSNIGIEKGRKYVVVPRGAGEEFFAQTEKMGKGLNAVAKANRFTSRAILGTSPSWAAMQFLAEGVQAALAVNPMRMYKGLKAFEKLPPEKQWAFQAWVGETPGVAIAPHDVQLGLRDGDMQSASDAFGVANKTAAGRAMKNVGTAELLGIIDRKKGGMIRRAVAAGHIDRELNSQLHQFAGGLSRLWRKQQQITDKLKHLPLDKQLEWFIDNPKELKKIQTYTDDTMGNWNALTHNEVTASSLLIFYPFLRMSLRWVLHSFPKHHPIKASILYYLSQQNANELQKFLRGNEPGFFDWAQVPIHNGPGGKAEMSIDLARMAPGANALVQGLGGGGGPPGTVALQVIQPWAAAAVTAATGVSPLGGHQKGEAGWQAFAQLLSLASPSRALGLPEKVPGQADTNSPTSEFFKKEGGEGLVPTLRSLALPIIPKPRDQEARKAALSKLLKEKYDNPVPSPLSNPQVAAAVFGHDRKAAERIGREREAAQAAGKKATKIEERALGKDLANLSPLEQELATIATGGYFIPVSPEELKEQRRKASGVTTIGGVRISGGGRKPTESSKTDSGVTTIGGIVVGRKGQAEAKPKGKVKRKGQTTIAGIPVG